MKILTTTITTSIKEEYLFVISFQMNYKSIMADNVTTVKEELVKPGSIDGVPLNMSA